MSVFKPFETEVLKLLLGRQLPEGELDLVLDQGTLVSYEYSGSGYYLTVRHPGLPVRRVVCNKPVVLGTSGDVQCGFVVFLRDAGLTLECHTWGAVDVPEGFREREVEIRVAG